MLNMSYLLNLWITTANNVNISITLAIAAADIITIVVFLSESLLVPNKKSTF